MVIWMFVFLIVVIFVIVGFGMVLVQEILVFVVFVEVFVVEVLVFVVLVFMVLVVVVDVVFGIIVFVNGELQFGQIYVKLMYGDWMLCCMKMLDNNDLCEFYQFLKDVQGVLVVEILILLMSGGEVLVVVMIVVLLEIDFQVGMQLQIDQNQVCCYFFMLCVLVGCVLWIGLIEVELGNMKCGKSVIVSLLFFGVLNN